MRILSLEIQNVRGIKSILPLSPEGGNLLIYGPNGTGKSAIVDAIDFLFSGKITRLIGKGTKSISLKKHGPHVDTKPVESLVKATIEILGADTPIEVSRRMSDPNNLSCFCRENQRKALEDALAVAKRGHYVLSRREILKFVAAEPGERAQEVQALLNLETFEEIRKALVKVETESEREDQSAQVQLNRTEAAITTILSLDIFSEEAVLKKINEFRTILGGESLSRLAHDSLQQWRPGSGFGYLDFKQALPYLI